MPRRHYTTAQRLTWQYERHQREQQRDQQRHVVSLRNRPEDDGIVDQVAVDLALRGHTRYAAALRREEIIAAVALGTQRGYGAMELADLLLLYEREVDRFRALIRQRERRRRAAEAQEVVAA